MTTGNGSGSARAKPSEDAITLLKNDHRVVEQLFEKYEAASEDEKARLAKQICQELIIHTLIEEEIFYPACREHMDDESSLNEAQVEHDGAKALIIELLDGAPSDDFYDAKVKVLSEQIKHHVGEEEKRSAGIFATAKAAGVDMEDLAEKLRARKTELKARAEQGKLERPQPRSFKSKTAMEDRMPHYRDRDEYARFSDDRYASQRSGGGRSRYDDDDDERGGRRRGRDRDEYGRFMSDDVDDFDSRRLRGGRGMPERDEYGRFMNDDDERGGRGGGYRGRGDGRRYGGGMRERDEFGRFMSDDDDDFRSRGLSGRDRTDRGGRERDEYGRFMSDDDRGARGRMQQGGPGRRFRDDDDDDGRGRGRGAWFGDREGHSEASRRGWESREGMRGRSRYDDDDRRGGGGLGRDQGGWFGDAEGHSEASRRGWEGRGGGRFRDDDDERRGGQGGWFGDPEGHAEAARRGWRNRQ